MDCWAKVKPALLSELSKKAGVNIELQPASEPDSEDDEKPEKLNIMFGEE